jgi:hypothetical protein
MIKKSDSQVFNPFSMERRAALVAAKSEVRVDE